MFSFTLFAFSGTVIVILTLAKYVEVRNKKTFFVLKAISRGDERLRKAHESAFNRYLDNKDKAALFIKKQLPLKARSVWNRSLVWGKESAQKLIGDLRDSRLLGKRSEGLSEFFKNISDIEKGNGTIEEPYLDKGEIIEEAEVEAVAIPSPIMEEVIEITETLEAKPVKLLRKRAVAKKPSKPRRKKIAVVEVTD